MNVAEMAEKNTILKIVTGSNLYGTNTPTSDQDFVGVFVADLEYYLGFGKVNEVDLSKVSKLENGKNAPDAIDCKLYEVRNFFKLAMDCNPNILEIVFAPESCRIGWTHQGEMIFKMAKSFPYASGVYEKYKGYAKSQKHKMRSKPENQQKLQEFAKQAALYIEQVPGSGKRLIAEFRTELCDFMTFHSDHCQVGDLNFPLGRQLKAVLESVENRLENVSSRQEIWDKHGYDTKFAMHLLRLLFEGEELLQTGAIQFPLKQASFLKEVRAGKFTLDEVMTFSEHLEDRLKYAYTNTVLRKEPYFHSLQDKLMWIIRQFHKF